LYDQVVPTMSQGRLEQILSGTDLIRGESGSSRIQTLCLLWRKLLVRIRVLEKVANFHLVSRLDGLFLAHDLELPVIGHDTDDDIPDCVVGCRIDGHDAGRPVDADVALFERLENLLAVCAASFFDSLGPQ